MTKYSICQIPYTTLNIHESGDAFLCCDAWVNWYSVGNIFNDSFEEIWNGEKAHEFRKQFCTDDYKYCNLNICLKGETEKVEATEEAKTFPHTVVLTYDPVCNIDCLFCAIDKRTNTSKFDEKIDEWLPNIAKNTKVISLNGYGEALASKHSKKVIKKCVEINPEIKFELQTNGILASRRILEELGILNNVERLLISVHAAKEDTYNKLIKNGNFKAVMKNLKEIAELKEQGKIKHVEIKCVITSVNYKEMVELAQLAKEYSIRITFLNLVWSDICPTLDKSLDITKQNHPQHNNFIDVIKHPIFKENFVSINSELFKLKKVSLVQRIRNTIQFSKEKDKIKDDLEFLSQFK